jgi:asparagine synthase (glutamine-hydrolysing)
VPGVRRQKLALYALCQSDEITRLVNWFPLFNSEMKEQLLSKEFQQSLSGNDAKVAFAEQLARTDATDPLNRMLYVDTKLWLPDDLLARGDKTSMAASVEARLPLLDHKLVEFAASLPQNMKLKGLTRKYLLRKVGRAWLPPEIISRKKKGFPMPISPWLRREAKSFLRDVLSSAALRRRGLFNPSFVERLLGEHESGFAEHGSLLWGLLSVELWQRLFLDSQQRPERHAGAFAVRV